MIRQLFTGYNADNTEQSNTIEITATKNKEIQVVISATSPAASQSIILDQKTAIKLSKELRRAISCILHKQQN